MMNLDLVNFLTLGLLLLVPAVVVFIILMAIRVRRGKFHRQRITRKSGKKQA
jgi:hypothetical protein